MSWAILIVCIVVALAAFVASEIIPEDMDRHHDFIHTVLGLAVAAAITDAIYMVFL